MAIVSIKRQITLPVEQCRQLDIKPGDEYTSFVHNGRITIIKKKTGAAFGALAHIKPMVDISDEDSLASSL